MDDRTMKCLGEECLNRIKKTSILLIGLGGVGGYAFEALVRSGFIDLTIIDYDTFDISNLNRQILSTRDTLFKGKCQVAQERARLINPDANIKMREIKLAEDNITADFLKDYDYIIDACDAVSVKVALLEQCTLLKKKLISCMGTANRSHPELLTIQKLENTKGDPLAKKIRSLLKDNKKALQTKVVCSTEIPLKQKELGTICAVPMSAGALLSAYVINQISEEIREKLFISKTDV